MKNNINKSTLIFSIDLLLLFVSLIFVLSGLLIQVKYHMNHSTPIIVYSYGYFFLAILHTISSIIGFVLMVIHIIQHLKWYRALIKKILKHYRISDVLLSIIFILTGLSGLTAWLISFLYPSTTLFPSGIEKAIIEIHDKLGVVFSILFVIHLYHHLVLLFKQCKLKMKRIFVNIQKIVGSFLNN
jgi:hypothetical protein